MCLYVRCHLWQLYKYRKYSLTLGLLLETNFRHLFLKTKIVRKILYYFIKEGAIYLHNPLHKRN